MDWDGFRLWGRWGRKSILVQSSFRNVCFSSPSLWQKTTAVTSGGAASPAACSHLLWEENSLLAVPPRLCCLPAAQQVSSKVEKPCQPSRYTSMCVRRSRIKRLTDSLPRTGVTGVLEGVADCHHCTMKLTCKGLSSHEQRLPVRVTCLLFVSLDFHNTIISNKYIQSYPPLSRQPHFQQHPAVSFKGEKKGRGKKKREKTKKQFWCLRSPSAITPFSGMSSTSL